MDVKRQTMMSTKGPRPTTKTHIDLSESALSYATKEIEVEEVDFSVEINGLMSGEVDQ